MVNRNPLAIKASSLLTLALILWLVPLVAAMPKLLQGLALCMAVTCAGWAAYLYHHLAEHELYASGWRQGQRAAVKHAIGAWTVSQKQAIQDHYFPPQPVWDTVASSFPEAEAPREAEAEAPPEAAPVIDQERLVYLAYRQGGYPSIKAGCAALFGVEGGRNYASTSAYLQGVLERGDREGWGS